MNKPTKPISSPGRTTTTEKFPPPLMRFLRSNVGNKSRRRSRASPMFVRKKNTLIETTQEPSSPKVTCIGQVRVSRSKKKNHKTTTATTTNHHHHRNRNRLCRCLRTIKPFSCTNVWSKWVTCFRCWRCGNSRINTKNAPQHEQHQQGENYQEEERVSFFRCCGSYKNSRKHRQHQQKQHPHQEQHQQEENLQEKEEQKQELISFFRCGSYKNSGKHRQHQQKQHVEQHQQGENHQEGEEKQKQELISFFRSYKNSGKIKQERQKEPEDDVQHVTSTEVDNINESLISRTPPKNAFLLTRCRSAPYRSSSLANIFRESMMEKSDEEEEVEDTMKKLKIEKEDDDEEEDEGTCNEGDGCEELKEVPLILGRCKSEPARTWDQLLRV